MANTVRQVYGISPHLQDLQHNRLNPTKINFNRPIVTRVLRPRRTPDKRTRPRARRKPQRPFRISTSIRFVCCPSNYHLIHTTPMLCRTSALVDRSSPTISRSRDCALQYIATVHLRLSNSTFNHTRYKAVMASCFQARVGRLYTTQRDGTPQNSSRSCYKPVWMQEHSKHRFGSRSWLMSSSTENIKQ
jgi:hypothetical protein